jgi:hypothetical protein
LDRRQYSGSGAGVRMANAAGFAPVFPERRLDDPAMAAARQAIDLVLAGHEPHPALAR